MANQPQFKILDKDSKFDTLLPTKTPHLITYPQKQKYLLIAPPKWGKTTFFSGCPNACLLAFEAGYSSAECPVIVITSWDRSYKQRKEGWDEDEDGVVYTSAMELIEEIERQNIYDLVIIDTIDQAVKLAADYHCELAKVSHPSEGGDFGRGWDLLQTGPIRKFYNRITRLGIGVACITHTKEKSDKDKFGKDRFRRETSLPDGVQKFIHAQSDVIMHGFFARRRTGQKDRDRFISFDGTNEIMAGTRVRKIYIPNKFIVTPPTREDGTLPWQQWVSFFENDPEAGMQAEKQFIKLRPGKDDETVVENENEIEDDTNAETQEETRSGRHHQNTVKQRSRFKKAIKKSAGR